MKCYGDHIIIRRILGGEVSVNRKFGVKSPKTTNSVQKSSEIRIFCTEFLYFACVAKIETFYIAKSYVFVFFFVEIGVLNTNRTPEVAESPQADVCRRVLIFS